MMSGYSVKEVNFDIGYSILGGCTFITSLGVTKNKRPAGVFEPM